jgi:3-oxoadipate enol-lactonase
MPTFESGGSNLYYERTGKGEPVLFLHGLGSSTRDWAFQVEHFSPTYETVTVDFRGHGRSDKPPGPYSMPQFAEDVAELIKGLALAPVHLVGISLGGFVAFQMAMDAPELLRSLVIVNSGPEVVIRSFRDRLNLWQRLLIVRVMGMRKMGEVLAGRLLPKPEHAELRQQFADRWAENDKRAYLDTLRGFVGWSVADRLGEIDIPALIVAADQDYTPVEEKEAYVAKMPKARLEVLDDCRHAAPVERPEVFNAVLEGWLEGMRPSP